MSNRRQAESEWVSTNFFVEGTQLPPQKPEVRGTLLDSAWDLKRGCDVKELEATSSMMGLFD